MKGLLTLLLFVFVATSSFSQTISGRCVGVADGDTFTLLLSDNTTLKVRLYGIDCPEKGQDYGNMAKEFTKQFLREKVVIARQKDTDRYGRTVAIVHAGGDRESLNEALLKAGLAWHYVHYDHNPEWTALEQTARQQKKGIWQMTNAIAPWEFRKAGRMARP